jgi:hypothetical protein
LERTCNYVFVFFVVLVDTAVVSMSGRSRNCGGDVRLVAVVPCTDSKSGAVPAVALRDLDAALPREEFARQWLDRIATAPPHSAARDLYKGPGWAASTKLVAVLQATEARVEWRILSGGYGLLHPEAQVARYSATVLAGQADSVPGVGVDVDAAADWFAAVNRLRGQPQPLLRLVEGADGLLIAASAPYVDAMTPEILAATRQVPTVIFCARRPRSPLVAALAARFDRRLREGVDPFVRGGDVGFNQRVATRVVELLGPAVVDRARVDEVLAEAMDREQPVRYERRAASDATVMAFIDAALTSDSSASRTALLRRWRDGGRACEQGRFGLLYERVVAERSGQLTLVEAACG